MRGEHMRGEHMRGEHMTRVRLVARTPRRRRGITLFEAVAALTIVAVTAVTALGTAGAELRTAERARRAIESEALLAERVALLALLTERELQRLPDTIAGGSFGEPFAEYAYTARSAPSTQYAGLYELQLTVSWPDGARTVNTAQFRRPAVLSGNAR